MMDGYTKPKESRKESNSLVEDRVSKLPDAILTYILSFLPTKNAVSTCILSKRWKFVWTFVPTLSARVDDVYNDPHALTKQDNLLRFVDGVLIGHKMPCLETINICCSGIRQSHISSWIYAAAKLDVRALQIYSMYHQEVDFDLPSCLFTMKNLVTLKLELGLLLSFPVVSACFPNLKSLVLGMVCYDDDESLQNLISSCHVLEEFTICRYRDDNLRTLNVSSRSLKRLSLIHAMSEDILDHVPIIIIDCPAVECIFIQDEVNGEYVVKDLSSLVTAEINFPYERYVVHDMSRFHRVMFELLTTISYVKKLWITDSTMPIFSVAHGEILPTFPNLTCLEFYAGQDDDEWIQWNMKSIITFLNNTPKLEVLIFEGFSFSTDEFNEADVPKCLTSNLKTIEINGYLGRDDVKKLSYFLENSKVLENISIKRRGGEEEIKRLPCSSKSCRISVS